jgi:hypothetical protein
MGYYIGPGGYVKLNGKTVVCRLRELCVLGLDLASKHEVLNEGAENRRRVRGGLLNMGKRQSCRMLRLIQPDSSSTGKADLRDRSPSLFLHIRTDHTF